MLVGCHVSVAKGYVQALDYAQSVGAECIQFFAKSPRQWRGPAIDGTSAAAFLHERRTRGFGPVFTHTAYLINLTSIDDDLRLRSIEALADELARAEVIGADGVVTHIGNDRLGDEAAAASRAVSSVQHAFRLAGDRASDVRLLLENTAGAGAAYGASLAQLSECIADSATPAERLGICIDTCHAFAYGYELETEPGCRAFIDEIESSIGLDRLGLIHANDCLFERGARRDRHAWIGEGLIGEAGFSALMNDERLASVPAITEMPGEVPEKDQVNLDRLKDLRARSS